MTLKKRKILICLIGLLAGLATWPIAETAITLQSHFNFCFTFSVFLGFIFGFFMGGFFGSCEGVTLSIKHRIFTGMITGAVIGAIGGIAGFLIGQGTLFVLGEIFVKSSSFNTYGLPASRAVGWAILGVFIGIVEGVRSKSRKKIRAGLLGGLVGGFVGGLALEYTRMNIENIMFARLIGLLIFGGSIGFFYSMIEHALSAGVLRVLNGKNKGQEFILVQRRIKIGKSQKSDICIKKYANVMNDHALLSIKETKNDNYLILRSLHPTLPVTVNDMQKMKHKLLVNDVIQIGTAKLIYMLS